MISLEEMLISDNKKLREAGCELAESALRVINTYDGIHRLSMSVAKWCKTISDEGSRDTLYSSQTLIDKTK